MTDGQTDILGLAYELSGLKNLGSRSIYTFSNLTETAVCFSSRLNPIVLAGDICMRMGP